MPRRPRSSPPARRPPESLAPIPIDRKGLIEALTDFAISSAWEGLRHFDGPASVADLAVSLGRPLGEVQRHLDALERAGLVRRRSASVRVRNIRYETTVPKIVIGWDPSNASHRALHVRLGHSFERRSAADVADGLPYDQRDPSRGYIDRRLVWAHLEKDDLDQLKAIVGMLDLLMARVNARHARGSVPFRSRRGAPAPAAPPLRCNYHISLAIVPIRGDFPPPALIQVEGRQNTPYERRHRAAVLFSTLTPREREVFDLLLSGMPLADIGRTLGISRPTVATLARHCYAKFTVGGRQQLVAATLGMERGPDRGSAP